MLFRSAEAVSEVKPIQSERLVKPELNNDIGREEDFDDNDLVEQ